MSGRKLSKSLKKLHLRQIESDLKQYRKLLDSEIPRRGWIREIRKAIGMTAVQLAKRLDVTVSAVSSFEKSEAEGTVALTSLKRAADALGCELFYVLIPRRPLHEVIEERARVVARERMGKIAHTMRLEAQSLTSRELNEQFEDLVRELSERPSKELWQNA